MMLPLCPYQRTLLEAVRAAPEKAQTAWNRLAYRLPPAEWPPTWQRLLPDVFANLRDQPGDQLVYRDRLRQAYQDSWGGNARLRAELLSVVKLLGQDGVPALALKGLWLNLEVYGDLGVRPTSDLDLLVPFNLAEKALSTLLQNGWKPAASAPVLPAERLVHATELAKGDLCLDLHWFLLPESRTPGGDDIFWEQKKTIEINGVSLCGLCPTHLFFHLLVLAEREPHQKLRYYRDLVQTWDKLCHDISLETVTNLLQERHLLTRGLCVLREITGTVPEVKIPTIDRLWSRCTQAVYDGSHEFYYGLFPLLDYLLHYRRPSCAPHWSLSTYLKRRLQLTGWADLATRSARKIWRTLAGGAS
jgi:hypothetical protein